MSTKPSPVNAPPVDAASASRPSQTTTPTPHFSCAMCDSQETKTCAGCKSTAYCGKARQKADWRCHKLLCSALAGSKLETERPSDSIRAIFFPADGGKPVLHYFPQVRGWVEGLSDEVAELFSAHEKPEIVAEVKRRLDGNETWDTLYPYDLIHYNRIRRYRDTENAVEVWWRAYPGSSVNEAIVAAAGGKKTRQTWTGSVLMVAMTYSKRREERGEQTYKDMTLRDFRDAVDWLVDFEDMQRLKDNFADATDRAMQNMENEQESM